MAILSGEAQPGASLVRWVRMKVASEGPIATVVTLALTLTLPVACASAPPLPKKAIELNAAGAEAVARGDLSIAEACLSVALEYSPRFVEAWVNLGYVELSRGNFEQARLDFSKARSINEDIPTPHHALGVLAERQGLGEVAERHYRAALKVDPGFAPARINLARRLFARGQYENAREQFERLLQVAPDRVEGWAGEAEALLQLGRVAQAESVVARGRERVGDAPDLMLLVARERLRRGDWQEAEGLLAPLVGGADRRLACDAWAWIAVSREARGDAVGSRQAAVAALAIDRDSPLARYVLAASSRDSRTP